MKNANLLKLSFPLALFLSALLFPGCFRDKCNLEYRYIEYSPVYMEQSEFVNAVAVDAPRTIATPGKILLHGSYLFVNEPATGIHVIDNQNPAAPVAVAFIRIPGTFDLVSDCDVLYADSGPDLLVFNILNPASPALIQRIPNALPGLDRFRGYSADPSRGVVINWTSEEKVSQVRECDFIPPEVWMMNPVIPGVNDDSQTRGSSAVSGQAGSLSRFSAAEGNLYVVTPSELKVFDASNCQAPSLLSSIDIQSRMWGGEAETVFAYERMLFVGSQTGMFIFDNANPDAPVFISQFDHAAACDPVVVSGDYAYVTLRAEQENRCFGFNNELDVVNVSNPYNPFLLHSYGMEGPQGLGIDGNLLFVTEGDLGFKLFDATNPENGLQQLTHFAEKPGFDVIASKGLLIMVGSEGISQYDYSDPTNISLLSFMAAVR